VKKRKLSTAKANAWRWCSKYIRLKWADSNGYASCVTCGVTKHWKELDAGHFIPKSRGNAIYFEEDNLAPQCDSCNRFHGGKDHMFTLWMLDWYGRERVEELEHQAQTTVKYTAADYDAMADDYRERVKELEERIAA